MEKNSYIPYDPKDWESVTRKNKITLSNPIFIKGLALAPVAVAATTLQNSLILSLCVFLLLTPTRMVTSFITRKMSVPLKTFFYPMVSAVIFAFAYYAMYKMIGTRALSLGTYLPILVVDPLIVKNFEKTRKESFKYSVINGLRNTAGFILACVIIGSVREILAFGTLGGFEITSVSLLPMAQTGFGGFLIIGIISALWHSMVEKRHAKFLNGTKGAR